MTTKTKISETILFEDANSKLKYWLHINYNLITYSITDFNNSPIQIKVELNSSPKFALWNEMSDYAEMELARNKDQKEEVGYDHRFFK